MPITSETIAEALGIPHDPSSYISWVERWAFECYSCPSTSLDLSSIWYSQPRFISNIFIHLTTTMSSWGEIVQRWSPSSSSCSPLSTNQPCRSCFSKDRRIPIPSWTSLCYPKHGDHMFTPILWCSSLHRQIHVDQCPQISFMIHFVASPLIIAHLGIPPYEPLHCWSNLDKDEGKFPSLLLTKRGRRKCIS